MRQEKRGLSVGRGRFFLWFALASVAAVPAAHGAQSAAETHSSRALWVDIKGTPSQRSAAGAQSAVQPRRFRAATLDRNSMTALTAGAPAERSLAARRNPLVVSLPDPNGGFQRFTVEDSPVMEPGLAAKHPEIRTYAGRGIDDPAATIRMDTTPLGFHASVRSPKGAWYIDPYYRLDDSLYVSYWGRDLPKPLASFAEPMLGEAQITVTRGAYHAADSVQVRGFGFAAGAPVTITVSNPLLDASPRQTIFAVAGADGTVSTTLVADPYRNAGSYSVNATDGRASASSTYKVVADNVTTDISSGSQLRTYRLALLTDPAYANYFGGAANVTAAKATLINRVTQVYEYETSIRLVLIAGNDALNLNTAADFSGTNGPCGGTACFPSASVSCTGATLTRNRQVIGLLVGASSFDIGHIAVGAGGGGIASRPSVGTDIKAQGCTGLPTPTGDLFAVDYVAHEMGHQFAGNHTFNGINGSCAGGNRSAANSVEPGSGTSIMAYAGICASTTANDNTQPHSDAYFSQRSFDEILTYVNSGEININEVQMGALRNFNTDGQQFQLRYNGVDSAPIVRGTNFTTTGVAAAIQATSGWPAGAVATVSALGDTAFTVTFGGTLTGADTSLLQLVNCTGGCTGYVGEIAKGGQTTRGGVATLTGNNAPTVASLASYTIPVRTPFALTGSAADADGDTTTYLWEQTDRGAAAGTALTSNTKTNGPLFTQFGRRAVVSATDTVLYNSPGENVVTTNPTRVFPDLAQILANNTNAETGSCPLAAPATPTAAEIECFGEFLPTADYVGFAAVNPLSLNFRVTARDGRGGVNNAATTLTLAPTAGPFLVTSPNSAVTVDGTSTQTITWSVANTNIEPVNTANVKISLSTDGGNTYPLVLAASTPNDGNQAVMLPNVGTTKARVKVEAIGNVFFDVSNADFTIRLTGDVNGDGSVTCADLAIVKAAIGQKTFDPRADVNGDGAVDIRDVSYVAQRVTSGTRCSP